jgi:hypothetical protein
MRESLLRAAGTFMGRGAVARVSPQVVMNEGRVADSSPTTLSEKSFHGFAGGRCELGLGRRPPEQSFLLSHLLSVSMRLLPLDLQEGRG